MPCLTQYLDCIVQCLLGLEQFLIALLYRLIAQQDVYNFRHCIKLSTLVHLLISSLLQWGKCPFNDTLDLVVGHRHWLFQFESDVIVIIKFFRAIAWQTTIFLFNGGLIFVLLSDDFTDPWKQLWNALSSFFLHSVCSVQLRGLLWTQLTRTNFLRFFLVVLPRG